MTVTGSHQDNIMYALVTEIEKNTELSGACIISFHSMKPIQFGKFHIPNKRKQFFLNCQVSLEELCNVHEVVNFIFLEMFR